MTGARLADIRMRDPFVLEALPGRFVLYCTTDPNLWGGPATGFDCWTSAFTMNPGGWYSGGEAGDRLLDLRLGDG